jgi:hypothetical protein
MFYRLFAFSVLLCPLSSLAHPVAFKGATAVMTWNQPFMSETWVAHSFRSDMAFAGRFSRMIMKEGELKDSGAPLNYLDGGGGSILYQNQNGSASFGGIEIDAEDRKYFGLVKAEFMKGTIGDEFSHVESRLGIAPYEAEYHEMASWFMVQAQWHPTLEKKFVFTPLARIFYKSFLLESGVSLDGDWMMNFMFHF